MKRLIALFILLCLAATAFSACKKPEATEGPNPVSDFEYKINGEQVTITKYIGTDKTVTIPQIIEGKIVTEIGYQAFAKSIITECVLPSTIRKIDGLAFALCSELEKITLNEGLITVEDGAFAGESKLSEIIIPKTVVNIDEGAFCTGLGASASSTLKRLFLRATPLKIIYPLPLRISTAITPFTITVPHRASPFRDGTAIPPV